MNGFEHERRRDRDDEYENRFDRAFARDNRQEREHRQERENEREHRHEHEEHEHGHERFRKFKKVCTVDTNEDITITTPVRLHAYVNTCHVELTCNGHEIIKESHCRPGVKKFKIRQKMSAHIPLEFVTECDIGEGRVDFDLEVE